MIRSRIFFVLAVSAVVLMNAPAHAQYVAEQVTVGNASTHLFQGTDADGGIDDWYLTNGVVEVIIDDVAFQDVPLGVTAPPKQSEIGFTGGNVIDMGLVGADNDQLSQLFTVGGLSTSNFIFYDTIGGSTTATSATITVTGTLLGFAPAVPPADLLVTTEYTVKDSDTYMTVTTRVENVHPTNAAAGLGGFLDVFAWVTRAIVPFSPGSGFNHQELDFNNLGASLELPIFAAGPGNNSPADGVVDPPSGAVAGEVAYGLVGVETQVDPDAGGPTLPVIASIDVLFGISNNLITALGNIPGAELASGASLSYERRVYVGASNDVASVANSILPVLGGRLGFSTGTISGNVDAVDNPDISVSAVAVRTSGPAIPFLGDPSAVTHFRSDATGAFGGVVLPEGTYDVTFKTPERDDVTVTGVIVTAASDTPVLAPQMSGQGFAEITIFETVKGVGKVNVPGRATFVGIDGTPDPRFNDDIGALVLGPNTDLNEETFAGGLAQRNFAYVADATGTVALRPGTYEVYGSHGPEYTLKRKKAKIKEGKTKKLKMKVKRVVETENAMSADFHVHSLRSFDTSPPLSDRVVTFAGEQVEIMISTDHDYHTDYSSIISALGLTGITSIIGNEVTGSVPNPPAFPDSIGHINAWPLTVEPDARRDGSIEDEFVAPNLVYSRLRAQGAQVIQYNHPRAGVSGITSIGFFNNFGYDPDVLITSPPNDLLLDDDVLGPTISGVANPEGNRNIDFDCMEIMNEVDIDAYLEMRRDWFSLLNQFDGVTVPFIAGTSVSDSHRLTLETAGYGRTYVLGVGDEPSALNVSTMNANIKAGKMVGTTGPYIEVTAVDSAATSVGVGGTLDPATSEVTLNIRVAATHWIPVEEVRIYVNGFLHSSYNDVSDPSISKPKKATSGSKKTIRFDSAGEIVLNLAVDSWIIVEAGQKISPLPVPDPFTNLIVPGLESIVFTNPIFIDLDGDGFDPPGLPVEAGLVVPPAAQRSADGFDLSTLSERKRDQVQGHLPIHKITIPAPTLDAGSSAPAPNAVDDGEGATGSVEPVTTAPEDKSIVKSADGGRATERDAGEETSALEADTDTSNTRG